MGHLRVRLRTNEIEITITDEESLYTVLDKLVNTYSELYDIVKNVKESLGEYLLLVNDVDVNVYGGIDKVKVRNSDTITFVPIVHGGRT